MSSSFGWACCDYSRLAQGADVCCCSHSICDTDYSDVGISILKKMIHRQKKINNILIQNLSALLVLVRSKLTLSKVYKLAQVVNTIQFIASHERSYSVFIFDL